MKANHKEYQTIEGMNIHLPTVAAMSEAEFLAQHMPTDKKEGTLQTLGADQEPTLKRIYAEAVTAHKGKTAKATPAEEKKK